MLKPELKRLMVLLVGALLIALWLFLNGAAAGAEFTYVGMIYTGLALFAIVIVAERDDIMRLFT